jgi:hypothetical protein
MLPDIRRASRRQCQKISNRLLSIYASRLLLVHLLYPYCCFLLKASDRIDPGLHRTILVTVSRSSWLLPAPDRS